MSKIFCLSFQKVGTTSLHNFLLTAGLSSCHCPHRVGGVDYMEKVKAVQDDPARVVEVLEPAIARFNAHSDVPYPGIYEVIADRYPDARFILMTRDLESWWESISSHWSLWLFDHVLTPFEYVQYRPYLGGQRVISLQDRNALLDAHRRHVKEVQQRLARDRLLVIELDDPDKSTKLADFLGLRRGLPYPHSKRSGVARKGHRLLKNLKQRLAALN